MAFCNKCGTEIQDDYAVCPGCGARLKKPEKKKPELEPFSTIAFVFSAMAWLFGFILTTAFFVTGRGIAYAEYIALIPAMVGLGFAIYALTGVKDRKKPATVASMVSVILDAFTILYVFIGFMIIVG